MEEEATQPGSLNHLNLTSTSLCSSPQRSPSPTPPCTPVLAPRRQFSQSAEIPDSQDLEEYWLDSQECSLVETPSVEMRDEIPDSQEAEEDWLDFSERSPVETSSVIIRDEIPDSQEVEDDWLDSPERSPVETTDVEMQDAIPDCQHPGDLFKMEYYEPPLDFIDDPYYIATQIVTDPRRLGQHASELDDEDLADVFCILHPASLPAYEAAGIIAQDTPRYTLPINSAEVKINDRKGGSKAPVGTFDLASRGIVSCDIALRLSAKLKDSLGGHVFGRNPARADFVFGHKDNVKRISNIHFRIYINEHGIIMLEDQSTNGTAVDGTLLRAKEKENGHHYRQTLQHGSIIAITMTPPDEDYKFIVRIPSRDEYDDDAYQANLTDYFIRRNHHVAEKKLKAGVNKKEPLNLFPAHSSISVKREWKGGPKYNKIGGIGKGAFAVVYKITSKYDGVPYAAKELEKRRFMKNGVLDQKVDSEMKIMQKIHHPNVVKFIEHIDWDEHLYIIMEFIPGGDLGTLIAEKGRLPEWMVKTLAIQLLDALKYLHGLGITHRDVKPDNILISSLEPLHIKLTDFGLSKMVDTEETFMRTFCGTLLYCAPEVYSEYREFDANGRRTLRGSKAQPRHRYGHAVDIWSLAGVLFYSLSGSPPFHAKNGSNYQELLTYIMKTPLDIRPLQRANISENGIRFVRNMLHVRPEHRATIDELQKYPWLTSDSIEASMEVEEDDDQVDMVGDGFADEEEEDIEKGASQLSLGEAPKNDENEDIGSSDITELQQQFEIPSSFNSSEDTSNGQHGIAQPATNGGRLFGEVVLSAYASSDAIPLSALNLPYTARPLDSQLQSDIAEQSEESTKKQSSSPSNMSQSPSDPYAALGVKNGACVGEIEKAFEDLVQKFHPNNNKAPAAKEELLKVTSAYEFLMDHIKASRDQSSAAHLKHEAGAEQPFKAPTASRPMAPPPLPVPTVEAAQNLNDVDRQAERSSSLMGAESMVGHLNMRSASSTPPPAAERLASPSPKPAGSLRRPREDEEGVESWWPSEVPPPKKRNTGRYWDGKVTKQIFWDPKDKTTWHDDYPDMTDSQYQAFKETARAKGEAFSHGNRFFHSAMQSFRSSRSPSLEPQAADRATSEPTRDNGRPSLLKRDDRKLEEDTTAKERRVKDMAMPSTAPGSVVMTINGPDITPQPAKPIILHDTEGPKRILAHFMATPKSQLPTIALPVVGAVTSWGRATSNTNVYPNGLERKIPKLAFKLLLFKPGFYNGNEGEPWKNNVEDKDLAFFISSKASVGIWVNGVHLPRTDSREADTNSKFWGELRHGDLVTVWQHDVDPTQFTKFRFECFWGKSKEPRTQPFKQLPQGPMSEEIDRACLAQEKILREKRERKAAEKKRQKETGGQDLNRLKHEREVPIQERKNQQDAARK